MVDFPLAHITWAVRDNAVRKACNAFLRDVFAAETAFEMVMTPELEPLGYDREETLLVIGDTMVIPIAPVGPGEAPGSAIGTMLRDHDRPGMWLGIALVVADLDIAERWVRALGCTPTTPSGAEGRCFLLERDDALGVTLEFLVGELPGDPRVAPGWRPERWRDDHPLGILGLQSIGVSAPSLAEARRIFAEKFGWPEISSRRLTQEQATGLSFRVGDNVIEAMVADLADSPLDRHARDTRGIYCLTFEVRSLAVAAAFLRGKGLTLIGDTAQRFAINTQQAFGRLLYFTQEKLERRPPYASLLDQPAQLKL